MGNKNIVLAALCVLLFWGSTAWSAPRADVDLDDDGLIEIYTLDDLNAVRNVLDGSSFTDGLDNVNNNAGCAEGGTGVCNGYELMNNLDFDTDASGDFSAGDEFYNGGAGWQPIGIGDNNNVCTTGCFEGVFEGNYFSISNLYIDRPSMGYVGLFGGVVGTVRNLLLESVSVIGGSRTGGLIGSFKGTLERVSVSGSVSAGSENHIGGLTGYCREFGAIKESRTLGTVQGNRVVGGLQGECNSDVSDSYSRANITGGFDMVGGLFGQVGYYSTNDTYKNLYSTGTATASGYYTAIAGRSFGSVNFDSVFWDVDTSGHSQAVTGASPTGTYAGLTTAQMTCPTEAGASCEGATDIYKDWSPAIWDFSIVSDYPELRWLGDSDGDGLLNGRIGDTQLNADNDDDNDGLLDSEEDVNANGIVDAGESDWLNADSDGDGLSDGDEVNIHGSDPLKTDTDNDGLSDFDEVTTYGTDPALQDTDADSLSDKLEIDTSTDPLDNDTDGDNLLDNQEDINGNGVVDSGETDPRQADTDSDGAVDGDDAFPLDDTETMDTDGDGIGNNADTDDDDDGVADSDDAFPLDVSETVDTDGDGTGNNADADDDDDGVADSDDAFPLDDTETMDTDGDGTGNNADTDDDGDGVADADDAFPLDDSETVDTDGDGIGNNADTDDDNDGLNDSDEPSIGTDPLNPDTDGDGLLDGNDPYPLEADHGIDTDGDGIPNSEDTDDDNDGILDVDEGTWDADGDGLLNQMDLDSDNDGRSDKEECPNGSPCPDSDGDGHPDFLDAEETSSGGGSWSLWMLLLLTSFVYSRRKR